MDTILLEIGSEEIPAGYIEPALSFLSSALTQKLDDARIAHGKALTYGTPKRLAVEIQAVAPKQAPLEMEVLGPPVKVGFTESGKPTVAAEKFAEKVHLPVDQLTVKETPKGQYLCASVIDRGQSHHRNFENPAAGADSGNAFSQNHEVGGSSDSVYQADSYGPCAIRREGHPF